MSVRTGSFVNNTMISGTGAIVPEVGMGVTEYGWTNRHAHTIIEVKSPRLIVVQSATAIRTDSNGMSDAQQYRFEPNPNGRKQVLSLRKDGKWRVRSAESSNSFVLGHRSEYYDYSF